MAIKNYTASADNTIVNAYQPNLTTRGTGANAGVADVLEVFSIYGRVTTSSQELSRVLVKFPVTDITTDRTNGNIPASGSVSFYLKMYNAEHSKTVPRDYTLSVYTVSQSWQEGVGLDLEGYKDLTLSNEGSNWMSGSNTANAGASASLTALSKTAGEANTRTLVITDVAGNSVSFSIDNSTDTSTATVIGFSNANSNASQFATNIAAAINAANTAETLNIAATASGATVTLTMTSISFAGNRVSDIAGTAITDSVITAASQWSGATAGYWTDINGTLLAGGSYITGAEPGGGGSNADVDTEIFIFKQTLTTGLEDLEINVTPVIEQWIDGTYSNHGFGVHLSASYEAQHSGAADDVVSRKPGQLALDGDDTTQSVIYNPSGSTKSYFTKRFFARGTEFFFKKPIIEARWNSATPDDRGNFFFSSSLAPAAKNLNTIYMYNYIDGQLTDIPQLHDGTFEKVVYVSIYSGSTGGFYAEQGGGDGDDVPPMDIPVSGATAANTGSVQLLSVDDVGHVRAVNKTVITGGIVSTGIYSASFAFTGATLLKTIYDVWFTGSHSTTNANDALVQYFTGAIDCHTLRGQNRAGAPVYYTNITNLKDKYRANENARFNLYVRDKYWSPTVYTVANTSPPSTNILSASYRVYRTLDAYDAIPYGTGSDLHTLMSYDISGNYFDLDMSLLEPGYEYALKFSFYNNAVSSWVEQSEIFKFRVEDYEY